MRHRRPVRLLQPEDVGYVSPDRAIILRRVAETDTLVSAAMDPLVQAETLTDDPETIDSLHRLQADLTALLGRIRATAHRLERPRPPEAA